MNNRVIGIGAVVFIVVALLFIYSSDDFEDEVVNVKNEVVDDNKKVVSTSSSLDIKYSSTVSSIVSSVSIQKSSSSIAMSKEVDEVERKIEELGLTQIKDRNGKDFKLNYNADGIELNYYNNKIEAIDNTKPPMIPKTIDISLPGEKSISTYLEPSLIQSGGYLEVYDKENDKKYLIDLSKASDIKGKIKVNISEDGVQEVVASGNDTEMPPMLPGN